MIVTVITPPDPILSVEEARRMIPGLISDSDDQVSVMIAMACSQIEPPTSRLGRAFGVQTLDVALDRFPVGALRLPYPPVQSVISISYRTDDGIILMPAEDYAVSGNCISPVGIWPCVRPVPGAIVVRMVCGSGAEDPALMPAKQAVALMMMDIKSLTRSDAVVSRKRIDGVGEWEYAVGSYFGQPLRDAIARLLARYRVSPL